MNIHFGKFVRRRCTLLFNLDLLFHLVEYRIVKMNVLKSYLRPFLYIFEIFVPLIARLWIQHAPHLTAILLKSNIRGRLRINTSFAINWFVHGCMVSWWTFWKIAFIQLEHISKCPLLWSMFSVHSTNICSLRSHYSIVLPSLSLNRWLSHILIGMF